MTDIDAQLLYEWQRRAVVAEERLKIMRRLIDILYQTGWVTIETKYRFDEVLGSSYEAV